MPLLLLLPVRLFERANVQVTALSLACFPVPSQVLALQIQLVQYKVMKLQTKTYQTQMLFCFPIANI